MTRLPARRADLLTRSVGSETVIVDSVNNTAHALSPTAASVFALCDSQTTVASAASALVLPVADVESAVVTLTSLGLVTGAGMTRRVAMQRASLIGGGALVASVAAPLVAAHASGMAVTPGTQTYDLFIEAANKTGVFTFAQGSVASSTPVTQALTLTGAAGGDTTPGTASGVSGNPNGDLTPFFLTNSSAHAASNGGGTVDIPAGTFAAHPPMSGQSLIIFHGSAGQPVNVNFATTSDDTGGATTSLSLLNSSATLLSGPVATPSSGSYAGTIPADGLLFLVLDSLGNYGADSTGISAQFIIG